MQNGDPSAHPHDSHSPSAAHTTLTPAQDDVGKTKKRKMKKTELAAAAGLSSATLAKLSKDEPVTAQVLLRICETLDVDFGDIMEAVREEEE